MEVCMHVLWDLCCVTTGCRYMQRDVELHELPASVGVQPVTPVGSPVKGKGGRSAAVHSPAKQVLQTYSTLYSRNVAGVGGRYHSSRLEL
jgi:hypothetical protein